MDQDPGVDPTFAHRRTNVVERHHDRRQARVPHLERERRRGQLSRDRHGSCTQGRRIEPTARDHHRTVPVPHRRSGVEEGIAAVEPGVGVDRDRGDLVGPLEGFPIQALDVGEHVLELELTGVDQPVGEGVEHEGVVGVGRVGHTDARHGRHCTCRSRGLRQARCALKYTNPLDRSRTMEVPPARARRPVKRRQSRSSSRRPS